MAAISPLMGCGDCMNGNEAIRRKWRLLHPVTHSLTFSLCGRAPGTLEHISLNDEERRRLETMSGASCLDPAALHSWAEHGLEADRGLRLGPRRGSQPRGSGQGGPGGRAPHQSSWEPLNKAGVFLQDVFG